MATDRPGSAKVSEEELRDRLTDEQYRITRRAGTEAPFSGEYVDCKTPGLYRCVCCGAELFSSEDKYDSRSGWPSFTRPAEDDNVAEEEDLSHGMRRVEVRCRECDAHLGHVFPDGPQPTGLRYCVNSASLHLDPDDSAGAGEDEEE